MQVGFGLRCEAQIKASEGRQFPFGAYLSLNNIPRLLAQSAKIQKKHKKVDFFAFFHSIS